jgi:hypothetical protein
MGVSEENRLEVAYDHYKEVFSSLSTNLKARMRLVLLILATLALMVFQGTDPANAKTLANQWVGSQAGNPSLKVYIDPLFISFLLWFALCSLTIQVFQKSLVIERQSVYLCGLEVWLDELLGQKRVAQIRYQRPRYFREANFFYFWTLVFMIGAIGIGKIFLEVISLIESRNSPRITSSAIFTALDVFMLAVCLYYSYRFVMDYRALVKAKEEAEEGGGPKIAEAAGGERG